MDMDRLEEKLTWREMEILTLLGEHLSNAEIADRLHLSIHTVKWYLVQILGKLGVANRREAVARFQQLSDSSAGQRQAETVHLSLPAQEPALLGNLPLQMNALVGRTSELAALVGEVTGRPAGLTTLTGPGGIGKTRLAVEVVQMVAAHFPNGAWFIDLAPLAGPEQVAQIVSTVLGLSAGASIEGPVDRNEQRIIDFLRTKKTLLLLDNCEHLLDACAQLSTVLLQACANLTILATSREPMGIAGEVVFHVQPLSVDLPHTALTPEDLGQLEAVQLFRQRAVAVLNSFTLTDEDLPIVARICQSLDGIPLAIELAAARVGLLSVEQIAERLEDRFLLLTGGSRTALPRQQTLRASIDWDYDLLADAERRLLQALSIFQGGCNLEAVEALWEPYQQKKYEAFDLLTSLVNKSLVQVHHHPHKAPRYRMLETIRLYGLEKLADSGDWVEIRNRHLAYFLTFAETINPDLRTARRLVGLSLLESEFDNFRTALRWALENTSCDHAEAGLSLAIALVDLWKRDGLFREGRDWVQKGLELVNWSISSKMALHARALSAAGILSKGLSEFYPACLLFDQSIELYRKLNDKIGLAEALILCADAYYWLHVLFGMVASPDEALTGGKEGDERIEALVDEALALAHQIPDRWVQAFILDWVSFKEANESGTNYDRIKVNIDQSITLFRETGDRWSATQGMRTLGIHAIIHGEHLVSQKYFSQALELCREEKNKWEMVHLLSKLGDAAYFLNDYPMVENYFREALEISRQIGYTAGECWSIQHRAVAARRQANLRRAGELYLEGINLFAVDRPHYCNELLLGMAGIALDRNKPVEAITIISAVEELFGRYRGPVIYIGQAELEKDLVEIHRLIGAETVSEIREAARSLTLEQTIELATRCIEKEV